MCWPILIKASKLLWSYYFEWLNFFFIQLRSISEKKTPANSIILPIKLASGLQISKLKIYENYLPWSSGITVLYWISVMFVKLISSIPWSVFSDTKFSNDLNSRLGGKLASRNTITIFLKKNFKKPLAYCDHC